MLIADVRLHLRPDTEGAFPFIVGPSAEQSRASEGCIDFQVLRVEGDPHRAVLLERWSDMASFEACLGSDAFAAFRERVMPLRSGPPDSAYYQASVADREVVR